MKDWEKRYLHTKAIRDSYYYMHNETPPIDKYGELSPIPKKFRLSFYGIKYWKSMYTLGHDHSDFRQCKCRLKA